MATMKTSRRSELKTNELILELVKLREFVEKHWQYVVGGIVAILVLALLLVYWRQSAAASRAEAMNALVEARAKTEGLQERVDKLIQLAGEYSDEQVVLAALDAASAEALRGLMVSSTTQKADLRKNLLDAAEKANRRIVAEYASNPDAVARAYLGLAAVAENRFNKDEARKYYKAILDDPRIAANKLYRSMAAKREATLDARMEPVEILPSPPATASAPTATQPEAAFPILVPSATQPTTAGS
jgi:hypothetical protein